MYIILAPPKFLFSPFSTYDKHEMVLCILLEYAEMDLNAVLRSHTTTNRMPTVRYFWNQMLEIVKVTMLTRVLRQELSVEINGSSYTCS